MSCFIFLMLLWQPLVNGITPRDYFTSSSRDASAPIVDFGYSKYQGSYDATFNMNIYRGIRFAAPPKRWQKPQPPAADRASVFSATQDPPRCPQSPQGPIEPLNFTDTVLGDEDCLFLNVFAPANAKRLPVLFYIHGGGYGFGQASSFDFSYVDQAVQNGFVSVIINYRLGAFGFASSAEIAKYGVPNADQVTISGESAGGGSVMLLAMANGGTDGTILFRRAIASSPYLPTQPDFDESITEDYFQQFVTRAGCANTKGTAFDCLQEADTITLQNASAYTSMGAKYGQWAFIPVTDGKFITERPSQQLLRGNVNGESVLVGSNANEGASFVPQNISTASEFIGFIYLNYPRLSEEDLVRVMSLYSIPSYINSSTPLFDSDGLHPPFATEVSHYAVGWQQAANNLYAETTFVCPSYWLADSYATCETCKGGKSAWKYQFSVPDALHGKDIRPLVSPPWIQDGTKENESFRLAFQRMWGGFVLLGDPTSFANSSASDNADDVVAAGPLWWKRWGTGSSHGRGCVKDGYKFPMLNMNVTNLEPDYSRFEIVDGYKWEGGRAERCALWAELGEAIRQ